MIAMLNYIFTLLKICLEKINIAFSVVISIRLCFCFIIFLKIFLYFFKLFYIFGKKICQFIHLHTYIFSIYRSFKISEIIIFVCFFSVLRITKPFFLSAFRCNKSNIPLTSLRTVKYKFYSYCHSLCHSIVSFNTFPFKMNFFTLYGYIRYIHRNNMSTLRSKFIIILPPNSHL